MKVLVCGGRDWERGEDTFRFLDLFKNGNPPIDKVITGGAKGADLWGMTWAVHRRIDHQIYKADWTKHGKAAGPIRNRQMLEEGQPDIVIAFPGGKGTANMIKQADAAGVRVIRYEEQSNDT